MTDYTGLTQKDLELIERVIYKNGDDVAVSIARGFERLEERLEERLDATESRLYSRLAEIEDRVEASRQDTADCIGEVRDEVHEKIPSPEIVERVD